MHPYFIQYPTLLITFVFIICNVCFSYNVAKPKQISAFLKKFIKNEDLIFEISRKTASSLAVVGVIVFFLELKRIKY